MMRSMCTPSVFGRPASTPPPRTLVRSASTTQRSLRAHKATRSSRLPARTCRSIRTKTPHPMCVISSGFILERRASRINAAALFQDIAHLQLQELASTDIFSGMRSAQLCVCSISLILAIQLFHSVITPDFVFLCTSFCIGTMPSGMRGRFREPVTLSCLYYRVPGRWFSRR